MSRVSRREWSGTWCRMPQAILLCCVYFGCISCQQLDVSDVSTTRSAGGALYETTAWSPLFKLCIGAGSHKVAVQYFFPRAATERLNYPYNLTELRAPWVMLYPESSWSDSYFYVGDCEARLNSLDPKFAQSKEKGGYRQFFEMDKQDWTSDFFLGSMPLVSFLDEFTVEARANATLYFALRHCHPMAIPVPMRFSVSVQSPKFLTTQPFSAVCLISSLKPAMDNSDVKSVRCESDVGQSCLLQGYRTLRELEDTSAFTGNKVVALLAVLFAFVATCTYAFFLWRYNGKQ